MTEQSQIGLCLGFIWGVLIACLLKAPRSLFLAATTLFFVGLLVLIVLVILKEVQP